MKTNTKIPPAVRAQSSAKRSPTSRQGVPIHSPGAGPQALKQPSATIQWRGKVLSAEWASGKQKIWSSRCGNYRINIGLDYGLDKQRCPYIACALRNPTGGAVWDLISKHGTLAAAKAACDRHAKKSGGAS